MFARKSDDERAQVGIGTLIVFIAMVLVAAIAAGVLINTAGMLQSQAEATGEESTDLVSERIDVTSAVGIVDDTDPDNGLEEIRLGVTGAAGADEIDLDRTIIQVVGPDGQTNLNLADGPGEGSTPGDGLESDGDDVDDLEDGFFAAENDDGNYEEADSAVLDDENDFVLIIDPGEPELDDFGAGDSASLAIVSPSGATTQVELNAPDLFTETGEAVRL